MEKHKNSLAVILWCILGLVFSFIAFFLIFLSVIISDVYVELFLGKYVFIVLVLLFFLPATIALKRTKKEKKAVGAIFLIVCLVGAIGYSITLANDYRADDYHTNMTKLTESENSVYNYVLLNRGNFSNASSVRCVYISRIIKEDDGDSFFLFQLSGQNGFGATTTETYIHYNSGQYAGSTQKTFIEASPFLESTDDSPKKVNNALQKYWKDKGV